MSVVDCGEQYCKVLLLSTEGALVTCTGDWVIWSISRRVGSSVPHSCKPPPPLFFGLGATRDIFRVAIHVTINFVYQVEAVALNFSLKLPFDLSFLQVKVVPKCR